MRFLAQGQPLMHFNDDLPLNFEGGMRGQCSVLVEVSDGSLSEPLSDACHQMDLPTPHINLVHGDEEGVMSLKVLQFVAGLPFFTQVDRLMPRLDTHHQVFTGGEHQLSPSIPPGALCDMQDRDALGGLLPADIERAFRHEQSLTEGEPGTPDRRDPDPPKDEPESIKSEDPESTSEGAPGLT